MRQLLRRWLGVNDLVAATVEAGNRADARASQAADTIRALSESINRENLVRAAEVRKADAAGRAASILSDAGF